MMMECGWNMRKMKKMDKRVNMKRIRGWEE
jgi:hypothetical protein